VRDAVTEELPWLKGRDLELVMAGLSVTGWDGNDSRYDMSPTRSRELLKSNKPTLSTHIHTTWPSVVEAIGHTGLYDYVESSASYGPFDCTTSTTSLEPRTSYNMSMQLKVDPGAAGFSRSGRSIRASTASCSRTVVQPPTCRSAWHRARGDTGGRRHLRRGHRRFTYMGYGGTREYVQALRDIVVPS